MMPGDIAAPKGPGICPPEARARFRTLQQELSAALQRGDLLRARGVRLSLQVMAIWWPPDEVLEAGA